MNNEEFDRRVADIRHRICQTYRFVLNAVVMTGNYAVEQETADRIIKMVRNILDWHDEGKTGVKTFQHQLSRINRLIDGVKKKQKITDE